MKQIGFAIGNLWRLGKTNNKAELLKYIKKLNISCIELTILRPHELKAFKLTENQIKWLKSLKHVTIHAPTHLARKGESTEKEIIQRMDILSDLYKKINAKNLIVHPQDLPSQKILNMYNMKISTENMETKKGINQEKLARILSSYPKIGLCLDVSHAFCFSNKETAKLVKRFGKRITQVHFSGTRGKFRHTQMNNVTNLFIKSIQPVKKLKVPIIIEEDMPFKTMNEVQEEIDKIKEILT